MGNKHLDRYLAILEKQFEESEAEWEQEEKERKQKLEDDLFEGQKSDVAILYFLRKLHQLLKRLKTEVSVEERILILASMISVVASISVLNSDDGKESGLLSKLKKLVSLFP